MTNQELFENVRDAIDKLFSDTSVSISTTIENLNEIVDEVAVMITSLHDDLNNVENYDDEEDNK